MTDLTGWRTIQQIKSHLKIPYETIRMAVKEARERGESWVRKTGHPAHWVIDTQSAAFKQARVTWLARVEERPPDTGVLEQRSPKDEEVTPLQDEPIETVPEASPDGQMPQSRVIWPELRQWLDEQGVVIFCNALCPDARWQWRWGERSGQGCASIEAATLAALQSHLTLSVDDTFIRPPLTRQQTLKWRLG